MHLAKYLLSVEEFQDAEKGSILLQRAFSRVDDTRRAKAEYMKPGRGQGACLGAGLLLQLAVHEAGRRQEREQLQIYSVTELLSYLEKGSVFPLDFVYGERSKPYFRNLPYFFNLSHSGDYVVCGFSGGEIGADIQKHGGRCLEKLAERFFTREENAALKEAGDGKEKLFYRLWTRKEAYGKLTGKGVSETLGMNLLPGRERASGSVSGAGEGIYTETGLLSDGRRLCWEEYEDLSGYSVAFCSYFS